MTHNRLTGATGLVENAPEPAPIAAQRSAVVDWDALLVALTARLRMAAGVRHAKALPTTRLQRLEHVVRECADDLALLHAGLLRESALSRADAVCAATAQRRIVRAIAGVGAALDGSRPGRGITSRLGRRASAFYRTFN